MLVLRVIHTGRFLCYHMFMKAIDWSGIYKRYKGLWVALAQDEITVLASGKTAKQVWNKARKSGYDKPILMSVPNQLTYFVGKIGK